MKNNLRIIMAIKKLSIEDVHKGTGLSRTTISNFYYERNNPNASTIIKLAKFLEVTVDDLIINDILPQA